MKIMWLGQAGLLLETQNKTIMVDPYLSNSAAKLSPRNKRRVSVDPRLLALHPDIILLTHDHLDHTDPDTLRHYLGLDTHVLVLAGANAWEKVRQFGGHSNNYVRCDPHTEWTEEHLRFRAVRAVHSDPCAVGFLIEAEGQTYYITGDTLYNTDLFKELPEKIDYVFLPVNGVGNNMNFADGARFCARLGAVAVPMHCGLFDELDVRAFPYEKKIVPHFFERII